MPNDTLPDICFSYDSGRLSNAAPRKSLIYLADRIKYLFVNLNKYPGLAMEGDEIWTQRQLQAANQPDIMAHIRVEPPEGPEYTPDWTGDTPDTPDGATPGSSSTTTAGGCTVPSATSRPWTCWRDVPRPSGPSATASLPLHARAGEPDGPRPGGEPTIPNP